MSQAGKTQEVRNLKTAWSRKERPREENGFPAGRPLCVLLHLAALSPTQRQGPYPCNHNKSTTTVHCYGLVSASRFFPHLLALVATPGH